MTDAGNSRETLFRHGAFLSFVPLVSGIVSAHTTLVAPVRFSSATDEIDGFLFSRQNAIKAPRPGSVPSRTLQRRGPREST